MTTQFWLSGTGLLNVNRSLLVSYTIPATSELTELSTVTDPPVIVAAVVTLIVGEPLSMLPPDESVISMVKPEIVSVEIGLRKLVTERATSMPPAT